VIDWEEALAAVQGDRELLLEILEAFLTEGPQLLADANAAASRDDTAGLERAAHTLKAALRYIGATATSSQAARLEQTAKARDLAASKPLLEAVDRDLQSLCPWIADVLANGGADIEGAGGL
jgi:two-component system, sensor histidine kinase and response regulator